MTDTITPHLKIELDAVKIKAPLFFDMLQMYFENSGSPGKIPLHCLRAMARTLKGDFAAIETLLGLLEEQQQQRP